jgi:ubiquinone/menaquinone biosynthesis C-methylase UbiE
LQRIREQLLETQDGAAQPMLGHLERLRAAELDQTHPWLRAGSTVLELGGGSGFQARLLSDRGCLVTSVDVGEGAPHIGREYPVQIYDGMHLPFPSRRFDAVYSSNVLEHVRDLPSLLAEVRRVLKVGGIAVHILPTPAWRLWSNLTHYPFLIKYALGYGLPAAAPPRRSSKQGRTSYWQLVRRALVPGPHGEYPSALAELWYFSRRRWRQVFEASGMSMMHDAPTGIFYTSYCLFPGLTLDQRRTAARTLGSACRIYVMRNA